MPEPVRLQARLDLIDQDDAAFCVGGPLDGQRNQATRPKASCPDWNRSFVETERGRPGTNRGRI
jgi:hypothetical protein